MMGCVSSKHVKRELRRDILLNHGDGGEEYVVNHVVSLTSSTYGVLKLDNEQKLKQDEEKEQEIPTKDIVAETTKKKKVVKGSPPREPPEVINAWELMEGLEEEVQVPISNLTKKSPKARVLLRGFADMDARSPLKFLNQFGSPRKAKKFGGKENKVRVNGPVKSDFSPKSVLKVKNFQDSSCKKALNLNIVPVKNESLGCDSEVSLWRRSFSPLFDPDLIANYERELSEGEEQIKRIISPTFSNRNCKSSSESLLHVYDKKCPPGGENAVVIYTTTLRGIRKTFEDCNKVRSIIESHQVQTSERDISMDSGFKEELRALMESKQVKVPLVFVKGRLIGGVDEVMKLEEEGKLEILFDGMPKAAIGGCEGCAGVRFMMCMECNGSCKVLDGEQKKMTRCVECNENGLIQCPVCC